MKFGYLTEEELAGQQFSLPPEPSTNAAVLAAGHNSGRQPLVYVGCAEWRLKEWIGTLYPPGTKETQLLQLYTSQFNVIEWNASHYRIYPEEQVAAYAARVTQPDFRFLPKFPQTITHTGGFTAKEAETDLFLQSIAGFGARLGPAFLQLSEYHSPQDRRQLFRYLATLPNDQTFFLELRHPQWLEDAAIRQELLLALRELQIGLVLTDTPGHRELVHMELTIPKILIRFVGKSFHASTYARATEWMPRLQHWLDSGLQELYFIVHTGIHAPEMAAWTIALMNRSLSVSLPVPKLHTDEAPRQSSLF